MMHRFIRPLTAILLAGGMLAASVVPVLAGVSSPVGSGTAPAGTCSIEVHGGPGVTSGFGPWASTTYSLTETAHYNCTHGQLPTSCTVILTGGPSVVSKTFSGQCLSGTQKNAIQTWAVGIEKNYTCNGPILVGGLVCSVQGLLYALGSGQVVGTLLNYSSGAMALPFYSQSGLTSWITTSHNNAMAPIYKIMLLLGATVALFAGAMRVVEDIASKNGHGGMMIIGVPLRLFFAFVAMTGFLAVAQWAIPIFNYGAADLFNAFMSSGTHAVFAKSGSMTPMAVAGLAGANVAGLIVAIVSLVLMLYLFLMFILRDVILAFAIALAPIAIGLAVYDSKNEMFVLWKKFFIGGLMMSLAGAIGVGVTFSIVGNLLYAGASGLNWLIGMVMMVAGLFITTKLMTIAMRGSMSHRSPMGLMTGMAEGALIGAGLQKAASAGSRTAAKGVGKAGSAAAGSGPIGGAASKIRDAGGALARGAGGAPMSQSGAMAHASVGTQKAMAGIGGGAMDTALASDSQGQQIIEAATAHMDPSTPASARLAHMADSGNHHQVLNRMIENGVGKGQLLGGTDPSQVKFNYNQDEMSSMMGLAHQSARTSTAQMMKSAGRGAMAA